MSPRHMSAREARANFGDLLGMVHYTKVPVIVEKKGRPYAVVISLEDYQRLQQDQEQAWAAVDRIRERNDNANPEDVLRDITNEVEAVRQERYEAAAKDTDSRR
jgi:prevent-host-death family protein